ncbi:MAG: extracellular solute-binding protein [Tyzzerella sp.]|nr:extracellular solute-binding protein [Tyzzerella sp.]
MKKIKKMIALLLAAAMCISVAACGNSGSDVSEEAGDRTVVYYAASYVTAQVRDAYLEMVETYNNGQGKEDGVFVQMTDSSGAIAGLDSALRSNYMYDVLQLNDDEYKALAMKGGNYFVALDEYLTDDAKATMSWDDIPDSLVNRFRMNTEVDENNQFLAGEGASLLALPIGNNPQVLWYNKAILEKCGMNLVSVPEEELEAYNSANSATLKAHGYAEYKEAPFADAKSSKNEAGEFVYKVFNECIPMNWEELRCVARAIQKQYGYEYGFMSEWWFSVGWSVGGDCIGFNEETGKYELTLTDKQANYLALEDITVNGTNYSKGDVLHYEDKTLLNTNASEKQALSGKIYELPSTYDAILEFNRLGVPADKDADTGIKGYGVAPSTTTNRAARFTSGTDCPFLIEYFSNANSYKSILGDSLGMTTPTQYREYVGGSTYNNGGTDYLKVIGETYDGAVYTGDLKEENGTAIVGECTTASEASGLFLPANTKNKNQDAAFKFASWVAGPEAQAILSKGNTMVPNQTAYGLGEYDTAEERTIANMRAGAMVAQKADIGDYTYFTSLTWITEWSQTFNSDVREGKMTLTEFMNAKKEVADTALKGMNIRILGR